MSISEADLLISAFEGAITVVHANQPDRAFSFDVTFLLNHPQLVKLASAEKPPLHFHPYQEEYIKVTQGELGVEVDGQSYILTPQDDEFVVRPWANHRLYPLFSASEDDGSATTRFLLSGEDTKDEFRLDTVFFQNWYGYQDDVAVGKRKMEMIQVMNMFDAGGSYLSFPNWIPWSHRVAQLTGIIVGRWVGGLLGYQPFYRRWTSDWQAACEKMQSSVFLRRFADRSKTD